MEDIRNPKMTMTKLIEDVVARYGRRKCLTFERKTYTYRDVNRKVNQVAHGLRKLGVVQGSRVGIILPNCPEYIFTYFGVLKLGAVNVPVNTFLSLDEIEFILFEREGYPVENKYGMRIDSIVRENADGISSTDIRHCVKEDESMLGLVPASVERYIKREGLYRP